MALKVFVGLGVGAMIGYGLSLLSTHFGST
jgi:hypothetical protein